MSPPILPSSYPYSQPSSLLNNEPVLWHAGRCVPFSCNHAQSRSTGTPSTSWRQQSSNQPVNNEYGATNSTSCRRFNVCNINAYSCCSRCSGACQLDGQPAGIRGADFDDTCGERDTSDDALVASKWAIVECYTQPICWPVSLNDACGERDTSNDGLVDPRRSIIECFT